MRVEEMNHALKTRASKSPMVADRTVELTCPETPPIHPLDLRGYSRLAVDATLGVTDMVETVHATILRGPGGRVPTARRGTSPGWSTAHPWRDGLWASASTRARSSMRRRSRVDLGRARGAAGGCQRRVGRSPAASANPLAIPMRLRVTRSRSIRDDPGPRRGAPAGHRQILVLAHGVCDRRSAMARKDHDDGVVLDADAGFTPVYLHDNSGLHAEQRPRVGWAAEALRARWPVPVDQLYILGHSMGGLLARSACYYGELAGHAWPRHLRKIVFLGTPHHGTTFERGGNSVTVALGVSRYTAAFVRLGKIPQRRHHRPPLRQFSGRGLGRSGPLRTRQRHTAHPAAARRRAVLCHRRGNPDG